MTRLTIAALVGLMIGLGLGLGAGVSGLALVLAIVVLGGLLAAVVFVDQQARP